MHFVDIGSDTSIRMSSFLETSGKWPMTLQASAKRTNSPTKHPVRPNPKENPAPDSTSGAAAAVVRLSPAK